MLVKCAWLLGLIGYRGITLWPFIFVLKDEDKKDTTLVNHERIHISQQKEMLVIPFYLCYLYFYIINRSEGMNHDDAYRNNPFEVEAYTNQKIETYQQKRKPYAWVKYIKQ